MDEIESREEKSAKAAYDDKCFICNKLIKEGETCIKHSIFINKKECNVCYRHDYECYKK